jgi:hypothetical protein
VAAAMTGHSLDPFRTPIGFRIEDTP